MKRRTLSLILSAVAAIVLLSVIAAITFKNRAARYAISSYFLTKGIDADFTIKHFSIGEIELTDIVLEKTVTIPRLRVTLKNGLAMPTGIDAEVDTLDIAALQVILKKINGESSRPMEFASLRDSCDMINPMDLAVRVQKLKWHGIERRLELKANHKAGTPYTEVIFSDGKLELSCDSAIIDISAPLLHLNEEDFRLFGMPEVEKVNLTFHKASLVATPQSTWQLELPAEGKFVGTIKGKKYDFTFDAAKLSGSTPMDDMLHGPFFLSGENWRLASPKDLSIRNVGLNFQKDKETTLEYELDGLNFKSDQGQEVVHGVSSKGLCRFQSADIACSSSVGDANGNLALENVTTTYTYDTSVIQVSLPPKGSLLRFNSKIAETLPSAAQFVHGGSGSLKLRGTLSSTETGWQGDMKFDGKNISLLSGYGDMTGMSLHHDLLSYPSLASSAHQSVKIVQFNAGAIFKNIEATYRIVDTHRTDIEHLKLQYEGSDIESKAFTVFPQEKRIENFEAAIRKYPLKSLLSIGLKDKVSASGTLSGTIAVTFRGKVPLLHGKLVADGPGNIQYRTGQLQKPLINLSDSPMDILYGYLYDFEYQTLSVDIQTNEKYKMDMILTTYGHNPGYLKGKPLKLKVNLEQNLLAAFRSMMLTYDLPNKIKEHLEKADAE